MVGKVIRMCVCVCVCVGVNWHVACKSSGRAHKFHEAEATNEMLPPRLLPTNETNETLSVSVSVSEYLCLCLCLCI